MVEGKWQKDERRNHPNRHHCGTDRIEWPEQGNAPTGSDNDLTETEAPLNGWGNHGSHNPAHAHGSEDETNGQRGGMQELQQDNGEETVASHQENEATW